jgi:hypothetical protein
MDKTPSLIPAPGIRQIVRPNADTLYSTAWLDLAQEPILIHVPDSDGRFYLLQFMDAWTETFADPGKRTTGTAEAWLANRRAKPEGQTSGTRHALGCAGYHCLAPRPHANQRRLRLRQRPRVSEEHAHDAAERISEWTAEARLCARLRYRCGRHAARSCQSDGAWRVLRRFRQSHEGEPAAYSRPSHDS